MRVAAPQGAWDNGELFDGIRKKYVPRPLTCPCLHVGVRIFTYTYQIYDTHMHRDAAAQDLEVVLRSSIHLLEPRGLAAFVVVLLEPTLNRHFPECQTQL